MVRFLVSILVIVGIGLGMAWAGSSGTAEWQGLPVYALAVALAFALQWLAFIPAWLGRTEKFYDLTGSFTYIAVMILAWLMTPNTGPLALVMVICVGIWAARLGSFLFARINRDGEDKRFKTIKHNARRFLVTWSLQGLWVTVTAAAALAVVTGGDGAGFGLVSAIGLALWGLGFAIEITADRQKNAFRADPANHGRFIRSGLWALCRHPNYFGEILLWTGIAVMAVPSLEGWTYISLISPVFVYLLLTRISGIPLLAAAAEKKWGDDPAWQAYKAETPVLVPKMFG